MRILGISGSLRAGSHNARLLRAAAELLPAEAELDIWTGLKAVPPYDEGDEATTPAAVADLRDALAGADAVLIATPEYNSSVPGQLKNALDWASRPLRTNPLRNKPVAVVGASSGMFGAVWMKAELRKELRAKGASVVKEGVDLGHAQQRFDEDGRLVDEGSRDQLAAVLDVLLAEVRTPDAVAA